MIEPARGPTIKPAEAPKPNPYVAVMPQSIENNGGVGRDIIARCRALKVTETQP